MLNKNFVLNLLGRKLYYVYLLLVKFSDKMFNIEQLLSRIAYINKITKECIHIPRVSLSAFDTDLRYVALVEVVHRGWFYK